jgi:hypothetical protein
MQYDPAPEAGTSDGRKPLTRRRLLGFSGAALLTGGCAPGTHRTSPGRPGPHGGRTAQPSGALGGNFNEDPSTTKFSELQALSASWLRGFVPMPDITTVERPTR